jgi:hypothetical protein
VAELREEEEEKEEEACCCALEMNSAASVSDSYFSNYTVMARCQFLSAKRTL